MYDFSRLIVRGVDRCDLCVLLPAFDYSVDEPDSTGGTGDELDGSRGARCAILSQAKIKRCSTPFRSLRQKASSGCKEDADYRETTFVIMVIPPSGKYALPSGFGHPQPARTSVANTARCWAILSGLISLVLPDARKLSNM